uniref:Uncharacterized protein n=1 Tax=Aegilops tauschii subsp. strangulata TaxID=200361 RepID=A0A453N3D5_AEGTS
MATRDEQRQHPLPLHILFLPFFAPGHLIPVVDMAAIFSARGARCTILTTPVNADIIRPAVDRANDSDCHGTDFHPSRAAAPRALRPVHGCQPPRRRRVRQLLQLRSFGEVLNSFHELEPDYVEHFRTTLGRRAWLVGPVALASKDMAKRGRPDNTEAHVTEGCLRWMDRKPAGSVVYVSFGTFTSFSPAELRELARGLDLSGKDFVWVISSGTGTDGSEWMPEGFAELMARGDRGFIIRGWAPQTLILNHHALGGFMTHCGWNSALEAVSAGVPMVTWPRYADQFYNEKLIVEVLKVGVSIGAKDFASPLEGHEVIGGEVIAGSIGRLMGSGEEGDAVRKKAKDLSVKARSAMEKGGSSYGDFGRLMDELMARRSPGEDTTPLILQK